MLFLNKDGYTEAPTTEDPVKIKETVRTGAIDGAEPCWSDLESLVELSPAGEIRSWSGLLLVHLFGPIPLTRKTSHILSMMNDVHIIHPWRLKAKVKSAIHWSYIKCGNVSFFCPFM